MRPLLRSLDSAQNLHSIRYPVAIRSIGFMCFSCSPASLLLIRCSSLQLLTGAEQIPTEQFLSLQAVLWRGTQQRWLQGSCHRTVFMQQQGDQRSLGAASEPEVAGPQQQLKSSSHRMTVANGIGDSSCVCSTQEQHQQRQRHLQRLVGLGSMYSLHQFCLAT
jgi:hypothetical protein